MAITERRRRGSRFQDMTGMTFGKFTVVSLIDSGGRNGTAKWLCRCTCGKEQIVRAGDLRQGKSQGCRNCKGRSIGQQLELFTPRNGEGCWEWSGPRFPRGYGAIYWHSRTLNGQVLLAHRVAYECHYGPIPKDMQVCHRCDNPSCVRPDHFFLGTQQDNVDDMDAKGRRRNADHKGERNGHAFLTAEQVREIRRIYAGGGVRQVDLAAQYGVSQHCISAITRRKLWPSV